MTVCIVDYGSGNLRSAAKAFEHAAANMAQPPEILVTSDAREVARAERVVLPGVGAFADCRSGLAAVDGMVAALEDVVLRRRKPFLGICVGMQLLAEIGVEHGITPGLGWLPGIVGALAPGDRSLKIPHMGWNELRFSVPRHPVLENLNDGDHVYFVHGYGFCPADRRLVKATVDYAGEITAVVAQDNIIGTQFHPEKSQAVGLRLIENFLRWTP